MLALRQALGSALLACIAAAAIGPALAQGKLEADGVFRAEEVLAKHDENYMPPEAADALKKAETAKAAAEQPASSSSAEYPVAK